MQNKTFQNPTSGQVLKVSATAYDTANEYRVENNTPYTVVVAPGTFGSGNEVISNGILTIPPTQTLGFKYDSKSTASIYFSLYVYDTGLGVIFPTGATTFINFVSFLKSENALNQANNNFGQLLNPSGTDSPTGYPYTVASPTANTLYTAPVIDCLGWSGVYISFGTLSAGVTAARGACRVIVRFATDSGITTNVVRAFNYSGSFFNCYIPKQARYCQITLETLPAYVPSFAFTSFYVQARRYQGDVPFNLYGMNNVPFYTEVSPIPINTAYDFYIPVNPPTVRLSIASPQNVILKLGNVWTEPSVYTTYFNMELNLNNQIRVIDYPVLSCQFMKLTTNSSATVGRSCQVGVVQL